LSKELTQEEIKLLSDYFMDAIKEDAKGMFSMEDLNGKDAYINISKITRFTVLD
jgi:hypothetical protein